jgi:hypothetical protein
MAMIRLGRADLSLLSDPLDTLVQIPSLTALSPSFDRDRAFVRFLGDTFPTGFHGEGRDHRYQLSCRYARKNHAGLRALRLLLDEIAPAAVDQRLLLRTHAALAAGLDAAVAVELTGPVSEQWSAPVVDVSFTVQVVEHSFSA